MSNEPATKTVCSECGTESNQFSNYCSVCGSGPEPWTDEYEADFADVELPVVFETNEYNDNLWYAFSEQVFGGRYSGSDVANLPDMFPRMKYCDMTLYWKLTEDLELEGPFLNRVEALKHG